VSPSNPFLEDGFAPVRDELIVERLTVRGELPAEIDGSYLRNGPNPAYPPLSYTYPFDGDGMIHALTLGGGRASYRNRFVATAGLRADRRAGRTIYGGLMRPIAPDPALVAPDGDPNRFKNFANTSIVRHAGRILALYEAGLPHELDSSLATVGPYDFSGTVNDAMTAHPKIDPLSEEMLMFRYSATPPYLVLRVVDATGAMVRETPIDTAVPFMVHDFACTSQHVVFFLCPAVFDVEAPKRGKPLLAWQPERGTRIAVLRRDGTGAVRWIDSAPFFTFHFLNAYESSHDEITVDYVQHRAFPAAGGDSPSLWRAVLDLARLSAIRAPIDDRIVEFPRIDPACAGLRHRYGWMPVKTKRDAVGAYGALVRYDLQRAQAALHEFGAGREVDEPVFIPRRHAQGEGDGWIAAYVYDRSTGGSICTVLDAIDIERPPVAEIELPRRVPHGLHGNWMPTET
jgi:carotenoid cleavage dioxygenase